MNTEIKYNKASGWFERDGVRMINTENGAQEFCGWMQSAATHNPAIAKELERFAKNCPSAFEVLNGGAQ